MALVPETQGKRRAAHGLGRSIQRGTDPSFDCPPMPVCWSAPHQMTRVERHRAPLCVPARDDGAPDARTMAVMAVMAAVPPVSPDRPRIRARRRRGGSSSHTRSPPVVRPGETAAVRPAAVSRGHRASGQARGPARRGGTHAGGLRKRWGASVRRRPLPRGIRDAGGGRDQSVRRRVRGGGAALEPYSCVCPGHRSPCARRRTHVRGPAHRRPGRWKACDMRRERYRRRWRAGVVRVRSRPARKVPSPLAGSVPHRP